MAGTSKNYTIKVNVIGDSDLQRFQRSVDQMNRAARQSRTTLNSMGKQMDAVGTAVRRLVPLMASAFSVRTVTNITKFATEIGRTADRVGLTSDALQGLRFAAEQTGVASNTLDMALQRFSRRVAEAAQGTGVLAKEFTSLNIPLRDASGQLRSNEEILYDYADAIAGASSQQEQLRLAFAAFDSEGAKLVATFKNGAAGVKDYIEEAKRLGLILDEDLVKGAENVDRAFKRMSAQLKIAFGGAILRQVIDFQRGLKAFTDDLKTGEAASVTFATAIGAIATVITVRLIPALLRLAKANIFIALATAAGAAATTIIQNWERVSAFFELRIPQAFYAFQTVVFDVFANSLKVVQDWGNKVLEFMLKPLNSVIEKLNEFAGKIGADFLPDLSPLAADFIDINDKIDEFAEKAVNAYGNSTAYGEKYASKVERIKREQAELAAGANNAADGINNLGNQAGGAANNIRTVATELEKYKTTLGDIQLDSEIVTAQILELNNQFLAGTISVQTYRSELERLNVGISTTTDKMLEFQDSVIEMQAELNILPEKIQFLNESLEDGTITLEVYRAQMESLGQEIEIQGEKWIELGNKITEQLENVAAQAITSFVDLMFEGGNTVGEILAEMGKAFAAAVVEILAMEAAAYAAKAALEALNAISGSIGGGGGILSSIPIVGDIIGGIGSLLPFAKGGLFQEFLAAKVS